MSVKVLAPLAGTVVDMADVPDPVFAGAIVGPGIAVEPTGDGEVDVVSPVAGTVLKLHPHAFVVLSEEGKGVLVHLGLDTVQLEGEGFTLHAQEKDTVSAGQLLISWNPTEVKAGGRSPVSPVVALEGSAESLTLDVEAGTQVSAGDQLFTWG